MRYSFLSEAHEVISSWNCHGDLLTYSLGEALHLRLCRWNTHEDWTHPYTAHSILKGNAPNLDLLQQVSFTVSLCMTINIWGGAKSSPSIVIVLWKQIPLPHLSLKTKKAAMEFSSFPHSFMLPSPKSERCHWQNQAPGMSTDLFFSSSKSTKLALKLPRTVFLSF